MDLSAVFVAGHECLKGRRMNEMKPEEVRRTALPMCCLKNCSVIYVSQNIDFSKLKLNFTGEINYTGNNLKTLLTGSWINTQKSDSVHVMVFKYLLCLFYVLFVCLFVFLQPVEMDCHLLGL